jgi:hypothetical protein
MIHFDCGTYTTKHFSFECAVLAKDYLTAFFVFTSRSSGFCEFLSKTMSRVFGNHSKRSTWNQRGHRCCCPVEWIRGYRMAENHRARGVHGKPDLHVEFFFIQLTEPLNHVQIKEQLYRRSQYLVGTSGKMANLDAIHCLFTVFQQQILVSNDCIPYKKCHPSIWQCKSNPFMTTGIVKRIWLEPSTCRVDMCLIHVSEVSIPPPPYLAESSFSANTGPAGQAGCQHSRSSKGEQA